VEGVVICSLPWPVLSTRQSICSNFGSFRSQLISKLYDCSSFDAVTHVFFLWTWIMNYLRFPGRFFWPGCVHMYMLIWSYEWLLIMGDLVRFRDTHITTHHATKCYRPFHPREARSRIRSISQCSPSRLCTHWASSLGSKDPWRASSPRSLTTPGSWIYQRFCSFKDNHSYLYSQERTTS